MEKKVTDLINSLFPEQSRDQALELVSRIKRKDVMGGSSENLLKARVSVLELSAGNIPDLQDLIESARSDFRDVVYWNQSKKKT